MAKTGPKGPSKPMDDKMFDQLVVMMRLQCTQDEICKVLAMSEQTLTLRVKERGHKNFSDLYEKNTSFGHVSLRRLQWKSAESGSVGMQIWLGKQDLGQSDKVALGGSADMPPIQTEEITARDRIAGRIAGISARIGENKDTKKPD